jgi:hypothetical protein
MSKLLSLGDVGNVPTIARLNMKQRRSPDCPFSLTKDGRLVSLPTFVLLIPLFHLAVPICQPKLHALQKETALLASRDRRSSASNVSDPKPLPRPDSNA